MNDVVAGVVVVVAGIVETVRAGIDDATLVRRREVRQENLRHSSGAGLEGGVVLHRRPRWWSMRCVRCFDWTHWAGLDGSVSSLGDSNCRGRIGRRGRLTPHTGR